MKAPLPPIRIKRPGTSGGSVVITKSNRDKTKTILREDNRTEKTQSVSDGQAFVGKSIGVTIPGPEGTYMSARVEAWAGFFCEPGTEHEHYEKASNLISEQLVEDTKVVQEFFEEYKR